MREALKASLTGGAVLATVLCAGSAQAAPEEIQVYMDEINPPAGIGLDLHLNYVADGSSGADFAGSEPSLHDLRLTPEFSLGLGGGFEAWLYLPLATVADDGVLRAQGAKVRLKWIAPHREDKGFYWGVNFEIGRVSHRLDENPWNAEFKGIAGWRGERWNFAVNTNLDFVVDGPAAAPATLEIASKLNYRVAPKWALGFESYNGIGAIKSLGDLWSSDQSTFATIDTQLGKFDLNAGLGLGYGSNRDRLIFKLVLGIPLPQLFRPR